MRYSSDGVPSANEGLPDRTFFVSYAEAGQRRKPRSNAAVPSTCSSIWSGPDPARQRGRPRRSPRAGGSNERCWPGSPGWPAAVRPAASGHLPPRQPRWRCPRPQRSPYAAASRRAGGGPGRTGSRPPGTGAGVARSAAVSVRVAASAAAPGSTTRRVSSASSIATPIERPICSTRRGRAELGDMTNVPPPRPRRDSTMPTSRNALIASRRVTRLTPNVAGQLAARPAAGRPRPARRAGCPGRGARPSPRRHCAPAPGENTDRAHSASTDPVIGLFIEVLHAPTKPANSSPAPDTSGCHCTATTHRALGSSIASTVPSSDQAVAASPVPSRSTAWP